MKNPVINRISLLILISFLVHFLCACGDSRLISNALNFGVDAPLQTLPSESLSETKYLEGTYSESHEKELAPFVPTEADVLTLREKVMKGMTDEDKTVLYETIINANLGLEHLYFYEDFFDRLRNPDSLYWNYFDETGEIQIGWAESSDGTRSKVLTTNNFVIEDYVKHLQKLKESVVSGLLDADFDRLMELLPLAKQSHDVLYVEEFYHIVHDMDYFLLRYGRTDVGPYVLDNSTITLYYGSLEVWNTKIEEY